MIEPKLSERYTVHYQPIAGGTSNTLCAEVIEVESDGTAIFRGISDSRRLHCSIRYNPNGKSQRINVSERLKGNNHVSPIKINGIIKWEDKFEVHAYTVGWQTSTRLGTLKLNIPGIEGIRDSHKEGMKSSVHFEEQEDDLRLSCSFDRRNGTVKITADSHPLIESVKEIVYDDFNWFHDAYPFSGSSVGMRIGFKTNMKYDSTDFCSESEDFDNWGFSRRYEETITKNQNLNRF